MTNDELNAIADALFIEMIELDAFSLDDCTTHERTIIASMLAKRFAGYAADELDI